MAEIYLQPPLGSDGYHGSFHWHLCPIPSQLQLEHLKSSGIVDVDRPTASQRLNQRQTLCTAAARYYGAWPVK